MKKIILEKICRYFLLGKLINWKLLPGGSLHSSFKITTSKEKFVIKELNPLIPNIPKKFEKTQIISEKFFQNGIPAVCAVSKNSHILYKSEKFNYLVFPYISGKNYYPDTLSIQQAKKIGSLLATMHKIKLNIPKTPQSESYE